MCAATPADCSTRVTGTIFDFSTRESVSGVDVIVATALQAATNPTGALALVSDTSDAADGRIDGMSEGPIETPIGIVALASAGGYYLTATSIASPVDGGVSYNVGTDVHDPWVVPESDLQTWSAELSLDVEIPPEALPLGDYGGVLGMVRDAVGEPVAGAQVASTDVGSGAFIRYLQDDGTFGIVGTSDLGIFVVLEPALAEEFVVIVDAAVVGGGTAGSANGATFTLIINVQ